MTKRMNFNPNKVTAGMLILDNGEYEFTIVDVKAFSRVTQLEGQPDKDVYGLTYKLQIDAGDSAGDNIGKEISIPLYMHTDKTGSMNKAFIMAALGFAVRDEADFNNQFGDADGWSVEWADEEGEEDVIGEVWSSAVGRKINAVVKRVADKRDSSREQNQFRWLPF